MQHDQLVGFGPYQLDVANAQLRRGHKLLPLPNKAFEVLRYLVEQAGQLVTKERLLQTVWVDSVVTETVLTNCIGELRQVLRDKAKKPRFIETVHRRGYRFIAPLSTSPVQGSTFNVQDAKTSPAPHPQPPTPALVGREAELARLHSLFVKAVNGERQVVFVTGEAGIGKTTLIEAFLSGIGQQTTDNREQGNRELLQPIPVARSPLPSLWIGRGQCIEQYGAGEAYLPVLEALGRLSRQPGGERLLTMLTQYAPTWLTQLPALLSAAELEAVQRRVQGVTRERMLRELAEVLDIVTVEQPLVLVLEDLHWSDPSTVELLAMLARRREAARLLVLGTYRAVELIITKHPLKMLKQELVARGQGVEIPLSVLSRTAVQAYITQRVPESDEALVNFIYQRTDGQPLFMVQMTDYLVQQSPPSPAAWQTAPTGLHQLIDAQLGRLATEEQQLLEIASVAGAEFAVASVAAGLQMEPEGIEELCERLAQQGQFLEDRGLAEWPDGTVSGRYGFRHALYQDVLYKRTGAGLRARVHRLIGAREESGYGGRAKEIAAELAVHFERGREHQRAVYYRRHAAESALQRNAYQEAVAHCTTGLALLRSLPDTAERVQLELSLQMTLGIALAATKGYAAAEVEQAYLRARVLCEREGESAQLLRVLRGLMILYTVQANFPSARELGEQLLTLAQQANDAALLELSHMLLGVVRLWLGELPAAHEHFLQGATFAAPDQDLRQRQAQAIRNGQDPGVALLAHDAWALWLLGYPEQARRANAEALRLARAVEHPFTEAFALIYGAGMEQFCVEDHAAQRLAAAALALATEQGFAFLAARGRSVEGWVWAQQGQVEEGMRQMHQSLAEYETLGIERGQPQFLADLADAYRQAGQVAEGLRLIATAQEKISKSNERWYEAELWRLKGELLLKVERGAGESTLSTSKL